MSSQQQVSHMNSPTTIYVRPNWQERLKAMHLHAHTLTQPQANHSASPSASSAPIPTSPKSFPSLLASNSLQAQQHPSIPTITPNSPKILSTAPEPGASDVRTIHADGKHTQPNNVALRFDVLIHQRLSGPHTGPSTKASEASSMVSNHVPSREYWIDHSYTTSRNSTRAHARHFSLYTPFSQKPSRSTPMSMSSSTLRPAEKGLLIIGPATVGGIKPGYFRIRNSGGMMDNIIASKLYHAGSTGYVSKSGGMSNKLNNILSLVTNGTYEGIAIGGDCYPGSTFINHHLRYEANHACKMLVLLGEVGGVEEYPVIQVIKSDKVKKPIVAWAIGTCANMFATEVQFGHAGRRYARGSTYETLAAQGVIIPTKEVELHALQMGASLLTIGSRFGGALDKAVSMFSGAKDMGLRPGEFVDNSKKANKLISGIGHEIKSVNNLNLRVELVKKYARKNFPSHSLPDYGLAVEKVTKLNIDGCIVVCFVGLPRDSSAFTTPEAADEYIKIGALNSVFVLGRSIGFIGHHLNQKRLHAPPRVLGTVQRAVRVGPRFGVVKWSELAAAPL
ncbi:citrate synthase-like protein [Suillus americanus]|nr:citrate synthase-like protein [Suillus americanus]